MKDTTHHLKHLQRKVIQSVKKAEAVELNLNNSNNNNFSYSKASLVSDRRK